MGIGKRWRLYTIRVSVLFLFDFLRRRRRRRPVVGKQYSHTPPSLPPKRPRHLRNEKAHTRYAMCAGITRTIRNNRLDYRFGFHTTQSHGLHLFHHDL